MGKYILFVNNSTILTNTLHGTSGDYYPSIEYKNLGYCTYFTILDNFWRENRRPRQGSGLRNPTRKLAYCVDILGQQ